MDKLKATIKENTWNGRTTYVVMVLNPYSHRWTRASKAKHITLGQALQAVSFWGYELVEGK